MTAKLEDVIGQLQELAKARPLKGEAKARARQLMGQLKKWGFTNAFWKTFGRYGFSLD
jgi:hypothetical protein